MSLNIDSTTYIYKSRFHLLEILKERGFDTENYDNFDDSKY